jgi:hypothetical protein
MFSPSSEMRVGVVRREIEPSNVSAADGPY